MKRYLLNQRANIDSPALIKGFTLIELMVAVSILSLGIVLVVRSFLSITTALDSSRNRIQALQLLETKMTELETKVREGEGALPESKQEEAKINNRDAVLKLEIVPLEVEGFQPKEEELEEAQEVLNEVVLSVFWQEANRDKDAILSTYLITKKTEE